MTIERIISSFISPLMQTVAQDIFLFLCSLNFFGFSLSLIFCWTFFLVLCHANFYLLIKTYPKLIRINQKPADYFSQVWVNLSFSIINSSSQPTLLLISSSTIFWFCSVWSPKIFCYPSASLIKPHILANISPTL